MYHETQEWRRYLELRDTRPTMFKEGTLEIVFDENAVDAFVEQTGKKIGVVYESPYHLMIVDLVKTKENPERKFAYERLMPAVENPSIVAVAKFDGRLVLLRQFRHPVREYEWGFPRGFGELALSAEENLVKELKEEIGAINISHITRLGTITPDSGSLGTKTDVFFCSVDRIELRKGYEEIESMSLLTEEELFNKINSGIIKDAFTISAFTLFVGNPSCKSF